MNRVGIRLPIRASNAGLQPAVVRSSSPVLENYLSPTMGRRDACPTAGKMPALRGSSEIVLILTTPHVHNPIRGNGNHSYGCFCPTAQARSHSLGSDLLRHCSHSADCARTPLWRGTEALGWALCNHHPDRHVRHADYRCQLWAHGGPLSVGRFGLYVRGEGTESAFGVSGGLGDDSGLPAPAAHQHRLDFNRVA